jgi:hypothetical protein
MSANSSAGVSTRIQMLRLWHRDGCKLMEHARHVIHNGQIWILYDVHDPQGTQKFGYHFTLLIVIDGRTDIIIGSKVIDICKSHIMQSDIDDFEREMRTGCNNRPEDVAGIANPVRDREFSRGTPLPATVKGPYKEPRVENADLRWYSTGFTTATYTIAGTTCS